MTEKQQMKDFWKTAAKEPKQPTAGWDIRRYLSLLSGKKFYRLLRCFGTWAWQDGDETAEAADE